MFPFSITRYHKDTFRIALPLVLSLAGQTVVQMVDSIMVGQLGAVELAAVAFSSTILVDLLVVGIGIAMSLTPMVGKSFAVGGYRESGILFQNSLILNTLVGFGLILVGFGIFPFLDLMGQPPEVIVMAKNYYRIGLLSLLPFYLFLAFKQFMEGIGNTIVSMYITLFTAVLNIILNYILIFGKLGCPELGVEGAALATLLSRGIMPIFFFLYMRRTHPYRRFFLFFRYRFLSFKKQWMLLKIGFPIAMQMFSECFSISLLAVMMGWIGTEALAANQVVGSIINLTYMISNGVAGAVTVFVSHALGKKNIKDIYRHTRAGLHLSTLCMTISALCLVVFGKQISSFFISDTGVIDLAAQMLIVAAVMEFFDGWQITYLGALRGLLDVRRPMVYSMLIYTFVGTSVGYVSGFVLEWEAVGVFCGLAVSLVCAAILLHIRFHHSVRRYKKLWNSTNL